jgi:23S rRNA pseudouridine2605 synthase
LSLTNQEQSAPKIQKLLADLGLGSRRAIESLIKQGQVLVGGEVAHIGQRISWGTLVSIKGKVVVWPKNSDRDQLKVLLYHKPEGQVCSRSDEKGRDNVFMHLPKLQHERWCMVGRLDLNSSGLVLFTNQGKLASLLQHPSQGLVRTYRVRVLGNVSKNQQEQLCEGVSLEDGRVHFNSMRPLRQKDSAANQWYEVTIECGKNRVVRRMFAHMDLTVNRLIRVGFGVLQLPPKLQQGQYYLLQPSELGQLLKSMPTPYS